MTTSECARLVAKIAVLKEIAAEYPGKTIENIIVQMEARRKEISNSATKQQILWQQKIMKSAFRG